MNSSEAKELLKNKQKVYYDGLSGKVWISIENEGLGVTTHFGKEGNETIEHLKWFAGGILAVIDFLIGTGIVEEEKEKLL
jgi:hypothetical protein